jgi:phosphoenolpyruvate-protein phosphotransferase
VTGDARGEPGVVVAAELSPADVASLRAEEVIAVATAAGAPLSHAAILVRALGVPAVTGLGPDLLAVPAGTLVLVDGDAGAVQVAPTAGELESARARQQAARRRWDDAGRLASRPAVTRDGQVVPVLTNVGSPDDARLAVSEGADGVGMLRTEFAFLGRTEPPGEQEQYDAYRGVADALGERPLVVRTLDLGADVPAWNAPPEPNPALGNRGIRFSLATPGLLETQLRAVARLARERPLGVMFPMVTTVEEVRRARACLDAITGPVAPGIDVGITVEVPAAAVTADVLAPLLDFFAIGTNDLTQYTLATDRANAAVAAIADGLHPAVLRLIRQVTAASRPHARPVCVVGELGSDPLAIPVLLGLGVAALSVRPNAVATVKQVVRTVAIGEARALAEVALRAESAAAVRDLAARHAAPESSGYEGTPGSSDSV